MGNQINHCIEEVEPQRVHRDGMLDATLLEDTYVKANILYLIKHGLGRPVKQYSVVFTDTAIGIPVCVRAADGRFLNDADQIGLKFSAGPANIRMRFC